MRGPEREELGLFKGSRANWSERKTMINRSFPSTASLDWEVVFRSDPEILGQIINDILKVDSAVPGKPGKRPALEGRAAEERLRRIVGDDYTALPFRDAVYALLGTRSVLWLSNKTGIHRSLLYKIMTGKSEPSIEVIRDISVALDKSPSYFAEYRIEFILNYLAFRLNSMPDATVAFYLKVKNDNGNN